jgi:Protein of unknown function (DUF2796)
MFIKQWRHPAAEVRRWGPMALVALAALAAFPAGAGKAHEHGVARVDIAVEPTRVMVMVEMPLDALLGFERAPRDDAERQRADAAVARLRNPATLFAIDPAAGCTPGKVDLTAPALQLGTGSAPAPASAKEEHSDLDGSFEFRCADGFKAGFVELALFEAFPKLQRIEVQAVTRKGQLKATLRRPASRVTLAR